MPKPKTFDTLEALRALQSLQATRHMLSPLDTRLYTSSYRGAPDSRLIQKAWVSLSP